MVAMDGIVVVINAIQVNKDSAHSYQAKQLALAYYNQHANKCQWWDCILDSQTESLKDPKQ